MLNFITILWLLEDPEFKLQLDDKLRRSSPLKAKRTGNPLLPKVLYSLSFICYSAHWTVRWTSPACQFSVGFSPSAHFMKWFEVQWQCHRTVGLGVGSSFCARDEVLHPPCHCWTCRLPYTKAPMRKCPEAALYRLLTPGFLICIAFVVAGGGRRLKLVVPKFNT